jgi:demethylmenaquinone methyltransferase / 2-methoxy-6-polyprenyl-1,4-benzoquinol methylase
VAEAFSARTRKARELFAPLGSTYDRYARLLSFGQDPRWRRFLVSRIDVGPEDVVLDVATGTGAVAIELVERTGCSVVGLDQSTEMLAAARARLDRGAVSTRVRLVEGRAEALPFEDEEFDALTFTYLLRYVDNPRATLRELARVVRPGGTIASLEFALPRGLWRPAWELYVRVGLPGLFLGPSIRGFYERFPVERLVNTWREAAIQDVRFRLLSFGGGIVIWGRRS